MILCAVGNSREQKINVEIYLSKVRCTVRVDKAAAIVSIVIVDAQYTDQRPIAVAFIQAAMGQWDNGIVQAPRLGNDGGECESERDGKTRTSKP
jgi:hypothetical protein